MQLSRRQLLGGLATGATVGIAGCTEVDVNEEQASKNENIYEESNAFEAISVADESVTVRLATFPYIAGPDTPVDRVALSTDDGELINNVPFQYGKNIYEFERPSSVDIFRALVAFHPEGGVESRYDAVELLRFEVTDGTVRPLELREIKAD